MKNRVQISLDDVKGIFKFLAKNPGAKSIFETDTLGFLKKLHQNYGTEFVLFCMCKSKDFSLEQVSDCYRAEFLENREWLHFGFHALDENSNYEKASGEQAITDYQITMSQIRRITGAERFSDTIRLHGFAGNREVCRALKEQGIRCFLTADDVRHSYYLTQEEQEQIRSKGMYFEKSEGLWFCHSLTRLEKSENPVSELQSAFARGFQTASVFTHEWQVDREDVRMKLQACCEWEQQMKRREL